MASNIGDIRNKVIPRLKGDSHLTSAPGGDVDAAILSAVEEYQKTYPLEKVLKIAGDGGFKYAIASLTGFVDGFSSVKQVAYPYVTTDQIPAWLEGDEFGLVRNESGLFLWFPLAKPAGTEFFLVVFTIPHTASASAWTPPATDDEALADLAAAYACDALATFYSQSTDASLTADSVQHLTKAAEYRASARRYRDSYKAKINAGHADVPAMAIGEIDRTFGTTQGHDYFFHGRRRN
jgi:hypothetical protein